MQYAVSSESLKTQTPQFEDRKIILPVDNEAVIPYLKQQYLPIIEELYFSYGFPKFHIEPKWINSKLQKC